MEHPLLSQGQVSRSPDTRCRKHGHRAEDPESSQHTMEPFKGVQQRGPALGGGYPKTWAGGHIRACCSSLEIGNKRLSNSTSCPAPWPYPLLPANTLLGSPQGAGRTQGPPILGLTDSHCGQRNEGGP